MNAVLLKSLCDGFSDLTEWRRIHYGFEEAVKNCDTALPSSSAVHQHQAVLTYDRDERQQYVLANDRRLIPRDISNHLEYHYGD